MTSLHQFNIRIPDRTRALLLGIRKETGMTFTQIIILAIEEYARKRGIKV